MQQIMKMFPFGTIYAIISSNYNATLEVIMNSYIITNIFNIDLVEIGNQHSYSNSN